MAVVNTLQLNKMEDTSDIPWTAFLGKVAVEVRGSSRSSISCFHSHLKQLSHRQIHKILSFTRSLELMGSSVNFEFFLR